MYQTRLAGPLKHSISISILRLVDALWDLNDEVEQESSETKLSPCQIWLSQVELTPKKCNALSLMGSSGRGAIPRMPSKINQAAVTKIMPYSHQHFQQSDLSSLPI